MSSWPRNCRYTMSRLHPDTRHLTPGTTKRVLGMSARPYPKGTMKETSAPQNIDAQLESLSERIRALRARRGMTRKDLSRHSDISERYLAQLESGKANPSVALLWRIANAMDINFLELLREDGGLPRVYPPLWSLLQGMTYDQGREAYE